MDAASTIDEHQLAAVCEATEEGMRRAIEP
jgi:hypothetical protein